MVNETTKSCSFCGQNVKVDSTFCNSCGASLTDTVETDEKTTTSDKQAMDTLVSPQQQSVIVEVPRESQNIVAIISLIFGIIAAATSIIPLAWCVSVVFCAVAIITGIIGVIKRKRRYYAVAGMVFGAIGLTLYLIMMISGYYLF